MGSCSMATAEFIDFVGFKQYTRAKQSIANEIRTLAEFLKKHLGERKADECRQLMVKLAEDRFALAVVGQFKRGKSSLMNAVIGQDLLPTGVLPLTSAITVLKYGPRERLTIQREGTLYPDEAPVSNLAEYVTEKGNPGNSKKVARAVLELPVQFLRRNLEFVDTPGIGSVIEANTSTTYGFLPRSDAVIFVTSVDTPLTRAETDFLQSIREYVRKVFFVVNKIDLVGGKERQEILDFVSKMLKRQTGAGEVRIYPVSSAMALKSKIAGEEEEYEKSGMKALQEGLSEFLSNEKSNVLLVSVLDKVLRLTGEAHHELTLLKMAAETSGEESQEKIAALKERFQVLREERAKSLRAVHERVILWTTKRASAEIDSFLAQEACVLLEELNRFLSQSCWKLSALAAQDLAEHSLPRFKQNLAKWTREETEHLDREILELLQNEWTKMEQELRRITDTAGEVLGGFRMEASAEGSTELPLHSVLLRPGFENVEWSLKAPIFLACLPVFVARPLLRSRLLVEIENHIAFCAEHIIRNAFIKGVDEALGRMGSEIEKQAGVTESRIIQAIKGKFLTMGADGHWQIQDLDKSELCREIQTLEGIERKLSRMRTEMLEGESRPAITPSPGPVIQPTDFSLPLVLKQELPVPPFEQAACSEAEPDLSRDFGTRGCPVCNRMIKAASRFLANRQYALANEERAQRAHAASLGFCPLHTWQLEAMASPQGLSRGFPRLMERLSEDLSRLVASENPNLGASVRTLVQNSRGCGVCRLLRETEKDYLNHLAGFVQTPEGRKAYALSQGLCLHHLGLLAVAVPSKELVQFLLQHAARIFAQISEDMQNYALKRDALRGHSRNLDEEDAYLRGIIHSVGARKVCFPWEVDAEV